MNPERWKQIENLYHAACELTANQRSAYLAQACADDADLRREVESLLAAHDQAGTFIDRSPDDVVAGMMAEEQAHSMLGRTLGRYQLRSMLGAGGMGEVYHAHDTRLRREVAVKILPEHLATDAEALRRFEREAKTVAALSHPNITAIFDFGTEAGVSYAVMELLEGETLRQRMKHSPLDWRKAVEICIAIGEGLAATHAKGIIHRDLKPENIFLTSNGQVKILDFGIARVKKAVAPDSETLTSTEMTLPGTVMGTIGYLSPEQVRGEKADAPSDLFSLGCVLYEMLSGQRPFDRQSRAETMAAILMAKPPPLQRRAGAIPKRLERIIGNALRKDQHVRYQTATNLLIDLKNLTANLQDKTVPVTLPPGHIRWQTAAAIGALILVLAAGVALRIIWQTPSQAGTINAPASAITAGNASFIEALRYSLEVESAGHEWKRATGTETLAAGARFRFHFTPRTDGYLYLIATGKQNLPTTFLTAQPTRNAGVKTNRLDAGTEFSFPGPGNSIKIGDFGTANNYTIIFSRTPLQQPAFLTARAERQLTAAEQDALQAFRQQFGKPAPVFHNQANSQQVLVTVPADRDVAAPLIFDISLRRQ